VAALSAFLWERGDLESQRHAIASLATVPVNFLFENREHILEITSKLSSGMQNSFETTIDELVRKVHEGNLIGTPAALKKLALRDWSSDGKIKTTILHYANPAIGFQREFRQAAVFSIRFMPDRDNETLKTILEYSKKGDDIFVKCTFIETFGELNWRDAKIIQSLADLLDDPNQSYVRRAALALAKLDAPEDVRRKASKLLCNGVKDLNSTEQVIVAEALGLLKIMEEDVGSVVIMLLESKNQEVKRAAGKALSQLND